jgi:hypothetical protein
MASLEDVVAELATEPSLWWGHHPIHEWIVLDRLDYRNSGDSRRLIRCRDWSPLEVSRNEFSSEQFVHFQKYVPGLPSVLAEEAGDNLLLLHWEFAERLSGFRVTEADRQRQQREAQLEARRQWEEAVRRQEEEGRRRQEAQRLALRQGGWRTCADPGALLDCLGRPVSLRKARLFGIACCRRVWDLMTDKDWRSAIELVERLEVGEADPKEVRKVRAEMRSKERAMRRQRRSGWQGMLRRVFLELVDYIFQEPRIVAKHDNADMRWLWNPVASATHGAHHGDMTYYHRELSAQADLLREILGDPFGPIRFDPSWRTTIVAGLAGMFYAQQTFEDLPIVADALEEAGCDNQDILTHLRSPGPHVRGCWALDFALALT